MILFQNMWSRSSASSWAPFDHSHSQESPAREGITGVERTPKGLDRTSQSFRSPARRHASSDPTSPSCCRRSPHCNDLHIGYQECAAPLGILLHLSGGFKQFPRSSNEASPFQALPRLVRSLRLSASSSSGEYHRSHDTPSSHSI